MYKYRAATLDAYCHARHQPYVEFAPPRPARDHILLGIGGDGDRLPPLKFGSPRMFAGRIERTTILSPYGFACTEIGVLIYEGLSGRDYAPVEDLAGFARGADVDGVQIELPPNRTVVADECVFFGGIGNFGHFIFAYLLKLASFHWLPELRHLPLAVYDSMPPRFLEFLDILGFPAERRILIPEAAVDFKRVWLLSSPMARDANVVPVIWPEALWSARIATAGLHRPTNVARPRLLIPRGDAGWRRVINEQEMVNVLGRFGVGAVDLSKMSARDQIATVSNASLFVSMGGAASEIAVFLPPDCAVIEIVPAKLGGALGPIAFAAAYNQPYARIVGRVASDAEVAEAGLPAPPPEHFYDKDFFVDCVELERLLAAATTAV